MVKNFWLEICLFFDQRLRPILRVAFGVTGIVSLGLLILIYGFYYPLEWVHILKQSTKAVVWYLIAYEIAGFLFTLHTYRAYLFQHKVEAVVVLLVLLQFYFEREIESFLSGSKARTDDVVLLFLSVSQLTLLFGGIAHFLRRATFSLRKISPSLVMTLSFLALILLGTAALCLPRAQVVPVAFVDLLFTSVSAVCVTGLSTIDVGRELTGTGQTILLVLIQLGGLGLMTLTVFFSLVLQGQVSVAQKLLIRDLFSEETIGRVGSILRQVAFLTFGIEMAGALLLFLSFPNQTGLSLDRLAFYSLFHSISAFCNAGFSLFPKGLAEDLLKDSYAFITSIMLLIVFGGLGFPTVNQLIKKIASIRSLHSERFTVGAKLILITTGLLLFGGTVSYWVLESNETLAGLPWYKQAFHSLFYSVTTRTAGFNTLDIAKMGTPMIFVSLFLMWVGASPNSTGGGIKTTTLAVAILQFHQYLVGKNRVDVFGRTLAESSLARASVAIILSLFVIFLGIFGLVVFEKSMPFLDICYEVVSAYATVGLSRGLTPQFGIFGKLLLCVIMFVGRVGVLTVLIAFVPKRKPRHYRYPEEYVVVG
ncbi:portal protein [Leptospira perolatii]|uniref:Portal protein n=1 Tax=Leptospira perolatii TaxID=2023191 RepID=A0A2M9ZSH2_9LEPT|nr:potassium transporter TrkG [Leptospira perolatii]PJZ71339.1 portal protein [Leptospira perolatii]PJZ74873.1 portal protein [Leptospira perolatii]